MYFTLVRATHFSKAYEKFEDGSLIVCALSACIYIDLSTMFHMFPSSKMSFKIALVSTHVLHVRTRFFWFIVLIHGSNRLFISCFNLKPTELRWYTCNYLISLSVLHFLLLVCCWSCTPGIIQKHLICIACQLWQMCVSYFIYVIDMCTKSLSPDLISRRLNCLYCIMSFTIIYNVPHVCSYHYLLDNSVFTEQTNTMY